MEYEILYNYDYWNDRESSEMYGEKFHTGFGWSGLKVGNRLDIHNDKFAQATAVLTEVQDIGNNVFICKTSRSCTVIRKFNNTEG